MSRIYTTTLGLSIGGDEPTWEGEATVSYSFDDDGDLEELTVTAIDGTPVGRREDGKHEADTIEDVIWGNPLLISQLEEDAAEFDAEDADRRAEARAEWGMQ